MNLAHFLETIQNQHNFLKNHMRLALYQPEIPQNTGTLLRLGACLNIGVDIIEPCGFIWHDQKLRRAGMDYMDLVNAERHMSWEYFYNSHQQSGHRLLLLDVDGPVSFLDIDFSPTDTLLLGKESCGVPDDVATCASIRIHIPMLKERRSLNVAIAASMVLTEGLRQTNLFPTRKEIS